MKKLFSLAAAIAICSSVATNSNESVANKYPSWPVTGGKYPSWPVAEGKYPKFPATPKYPKYPASPKFPKFPSWLSEPVASWPVG